jgi:hypothetical protein
MLRNIRFQAHPADRALAETPFPFVGVHGTGIDPGGQLFGRSGVNALVKKAPGFGEKFIAAARAAEIVGLPGMLGALRACGIDRHSADRIFVRSAFGLSLILHR